MATSDEIKHLVRAHVNGDHERFRAVSLAIAANAESKSPAFAKAVRELAAIEPRKSAMHVTQLTSLPGKSSLEVSRPTVKLRDMVLDIPSLKMFERVLAEQSARDKLSVHGLRPMSKLLLVGPPGVGKTMMASALAGELEIPLLRVALHETISQHLGETASKLGKIFETVSSVRGVYLFDEFDALASQRWRSGSDDGGEMRRVVNSLLMFIEDDQSSSLIVAATNYVGAIDQAMFRRFDAVIRLPVLDAGSAERLVRARIGRIFSANDFAASGVGISWDVVRRAAAGMGHADVVAACDQACKDAILMDRPIVETDELIAAFARTGHPAYLSFDSGSFDPNRIG